MTDAGYPQEAEVSVLGGLLLDDPEAASTAFARLESGDFFRKAHRRIFEAAHALHERGDPIEVIALTEELRSTNRLEEAGGMDYLSELLDAVPTAANIGYHAGIVREAGARRRVHQLARELALEAGSTERTPEELLAWGEERIRALQNGRTSRFHFRTDRELRDLEPPPQLVDGILPKGGLCALVGPPGSGKTFLALDWAFSVRSGLPWVDGRAVHTGPVHYVLAEGAAALGPRIEAWCDYQIQGADAGVLFLTQPIQLMEPAEVSAFLAAVRSQGEPPALIVFDTLARCMVGGDENSAQDMGLLIAGADRVREESGATVLLQHHTNVSGERERGSTALRGAVDTLLSLKRTEDGYLKLSCLKQKDAPEFDPIPLELKPRLSSAIITPRSGHGVVGDGLLSGELDSLRQLHAIEMPDGVSATQWKDACNLPDSTFYKYRKALWEKGFVRSENVRGYPRYWVSDKGKEVVTP